MLIAISSEDFKEFHKNFQKFSVDFGASSGMFTMETMAIFLSPRILS